MIKSCYPDRAISAPIQEKGGLICPSDAKVLFTTANMTEPKMILEIGTYKGKTTLGLANSALDAQVYTMDIFREMRKDINPSQRVEILPKTKVGRVFKNKKKNIIQIFGDSRDIASYPFRGKKIDLAFIDGDHSLKAVIQDSLNVLKFMKRRSIIFWHDFFGDKNSQQVSAALGYLAVRKRLDIFHIKNTRLAFCLLNR